jgi:hypothetical protein
MVTVVSVFMGAGGGIQITVTIVTTVTQGAGKKSRGHILAGGDFPQGNTTRTPLLFATDNTCRQRESNAFPSA